MTDKRYFDIIRKTEITQLIEILQLYKTYQQNGIENECAEVLETMIKEKVAARSQQ